MKLRYPLLLLFIFLPGFLDAQNVGINNTGNSPDPNAMLDIEASNKGLLIPRIDYNNRPTTGLTEGLLIYATTNAPSGTGFYYYNGTQWVPLLANGNTSGAGGWSVTGNSGLNAGTNYLGTDDAVDLVIKTNGTEKMRVLSSGEVGIGTATPDDDLDVVGNEQVSGYLKVGNPTAPTSVSSTWLNFFDWTAEETFSDWTIGNPCGGSIWTSAYIGGDPYISYDNQGARSISYLYSRWFWVPSGASNLIGRLLFDCSLESGWDGVYLEYTTDGATFNKVTSFSQNGYLAMNAGAGSNSGCTGGNAQDSWNGSYGQSESIFSIAGVAGTWVRFRFVGMEDGATSTGDFQLYGMSLKGQFPTYGGAMAAGNIYAENNVYAGSNVLQGDVAEYFPVHDETEAGDLISIDPDNPDSYRVSAQKNGPNLFGVHSTAPTVTLNDPNSGAPVALQGRVPVKVTTENGNIQPGDPLTSSGKKGYAMKATESCRIIGKALESLKEGNGKVLCLLTPSWYQHDSQSAAQQSNGQFKILPGNQEVLVNDPAMQSNSKVFISMLDNPGSQYWVTSKERGSFKIALASPSSKAIKFDYLIDNASSVERPATTKQAPEKKEENENTVVADRTSSLPKEKGETPPAEVPDPSKIYSWSAESGLEELGEPPSKED